MPPAIPQSAADASPGPLTAQPITATVMGLSTPFSRSSTWEARPIRSMRVRPQVGQETSSAPVSYTHLDVYKRKVFALDQGPHPLHRPLLQLHPGGHIPEEAGVAQLHMEP